MKTITYPKKWWRQKPMRPIKEASVASMLSSWTPSLLCFILLAAPMGRRKSGLWSNVITNFEFCASHFLEVRDWRVRDEMWQLWRACRTVGSYDLVSKKEEKGQCPYPSRTPLLWKCEFWVCFGLYLFFFLVTLKFSVLWTLDFGVAVCQYLTSCDGGWMMTWRSFHVDKGK